MKMLESDRIDKPEGIDQAGVLFAINITFLKQILDFSQKYGMAVMIECKNL